MENNPSKTSESPVNTGGTWPGDVLALQETAIKDGVISLRQTKTGASVRIAIAGALKIVLDRILARKRTYPVRSLSLLVDETGKRITKHMLRYQFEKARDMVPSAAEFQFRDLRAKAVTDVREEYGLDAAKDLAGHASVVMTEHYTRARKGEIRSAIPRKTASENGIK